VVLFYISYMNKYKSHEQWAALAPLDVIRVETALSRYPIHRLAKQGRIAIELKETTEGGETALWWEVSHNFRYGQPGPLAYCLWPQVMQGIRSHGLCWDRTRPSIVRWPDAWTTTPTALHRHG